MISDLAALFLTGLVFELWLSSLPSFFFWSASDLSDWHWSGTAPTRDSFICLSCFHCQLLCVASPHLGGNSQSAQPLAGLHMEKKEIPFIFFLYFGFLCRLMTHDTFHGALWSAIGQHLIQHWKTSRLMHENPTDTCWYVNLNVSNLHNGPTEYIKLHLIHLWLSCKAGLTLTSAQPE